MSGAFFSALLFETVSWDYKVIKDKLGHQVDLDESDPFEYSKSIGKGFVEIASATIKGLSEDECEKLNHELKSLRVQKEAVVGELDTLRTREDAISQTIRNRRPAHYSINNNSDQAESNDRQVMER